MATTGLPPAGYEADQDRGPAFFGFVIFMLCVGIAATGLRVWARLSSSPDSRLKARFWWDDLLALIAVPFFIAAAIQLLVMVHLGLGRHTWNVDPENIIPSLKILFATYFFYDMALATCKASALLFYTRMFRNNLSRPWFKWSIWILHFMNIAWVVGLYIANFVQCDPVQKNWNPFLPGKCSPISAIWMASAIPSMVIDLFILLLPLPMIWVLDLSRSKKIGLTAIFLLGYSTIIVSIGRVIVVTKDQSLVNDDFFYESIPVLYWITTEIPVTMLSISLPTMIILGHRAIRAITGILYAAQSKLNSLRAPKRTRPGSIDSEKGFARQGSTDSSQADSGDRPRPRLQTQSRNYNAQISCRDPSDSPITWKEAAITVKSTITVSRFEEELWDEDEITPPLPALPAAAMGLGPRFDV